MSIYHIIKSQYLDITTTLYMKNKAREGTYQVAALLVSFILIHSIYMGIVRPTAEATLLIESQISQADQATATEEAVTGSWGGRLAVILKDWEQEICFIAALWFLFIMLFKHGEMSNAYRLFDARGRREQDNFLETEEGGVVLPQPEDRQKYRAIFENIHQQGKADGILFHATSACVDRFFTTSKVSDATDAMQQVCVIEAERLETGLSIIRYLVWFIPSIGFIGTVRGISQALTQAEEAIQGNIAPVTESLGTAFNSTLIALSISIVVMFGLHRLQASQELLILKVQEFCNQNLLRYLQEK